MKKREILELWYEEVWQNGNLDVIDQLFENVSAAQGFLHDSNVTRQEIEELVTASKMLLNNIRPEIIHTVEDENWLAALVTVHGNRPDNGAPVEFSSHVMIRFNNGKIAEKHNLLDFFSLFEQLDQLPEDALAVCVTGQRLDFT
jgi:predicted ester cyclase